MSATGSSRDEHRPSPVVQTVTGPLPADQLGRTLVHEHALIAFPGAMLDPAARAKHSSLVAQVSEDFSALHDVGVRTVVDPCPIELGRDVELLAKVSQATGINIICATGFYHEGDGLGIPNYWRMRHPEEIAELYVSELTEGVGSTGIRPGVVKAATGDPVGAHETKVLRAAGMAAAATGVAIITHTDNSAHGHEQQRLLGEGGASLDRCLVGHQDSQSVDGVVALAQEGSFIGIDRVGYESIVKDEHRADVVVGAVRSGQGHRICISQDRMCVHWSPRPSFWVPRGRERYVEEEVLPALRRDSVDRGLTWLVTSFLDLLRDRGLHEDEIDSLLVGNPRRLLSGT